MDVSVIIPVYKVEDYIGRCVLSIINQTCKRISVECILVDDKSPDRSIEKAENLIEKYEGDIVFKIIRHEFNQGLSAARNTGMKYATGKYIYFLDSDDDLAPSCIQKLFDVSINYPDVQMVMGNYLDKKTNTLGINNSRIPKRVVDNYLLMEMYYLSYIPVMAWNCLIRKDVIVKNNLSFRKGLLQEDMLWSSQLFRHIDRFYFLPEVTLNYEYNPMSTMAELKIDETRHIPHQLFIINELLNTFRKDHLVSNTLYIVSELLLVIDVIWKKKNHVDDTWIKQAFEYRNRIFKMSLSECRFILVFFELIMFKPFGYLMKVRLFRKNYHRIRMAFYRFASVFDFIHRN